MGFRFGLLALDFGGSARSAGLRASLPQRTALLARYIEEFDADGFLIHSVKSCNSFSAGQLLILRELERRTGRPGGFIESDLVDSRYFSAANIKNRLESYLQMIEQTRRARSAS